MTLPLGSIQYPQIYGKIAPIPVYGKIASIPVYGHVERVLLTVLDGTDLESVVGTNIAGVDLVAGLVVVSNPSGEAIIADITEITHSNILLGVVIESKSAGELIQSTREGILSLSSFNFTPGNPLFLGLNGVITENFVEQGLFAVKIGFAITANTIYIDFDQPINY